jgi:hypothetical protein
MVMFHYSAQTLPEPSPSSLKAPQAMVVFHESAQSTLGQFRKR